ncbi:MAG: AbrB/MazE/SpoVT family DNA-binding domain-containing protein, partial [Nitrososphaeria archaeon]|nr:AbrB/MazE/SpoVT family DNA-binding domain-containing protein [Nitrososphaeria archaeon]
MKQTTPIFRSKAQGGKLTITIPEEMVRSFDLKEGDKLSWEVETREILGRGGIGK